MKINSVLVNIAFFVLPVIYMLGLAFVETTMPLDQKKYFYSNLAFWRSCRNWACSFPVSDDMAFRNLMQRSHAG